MGIGLTCGGWKYAAASVIGTSHLKSPHGVCQDSHAIKYIERASALVGIVCDGAGSASHAHIGSRLTCDLVVEELSNVLPGRLFDQSAAHQTLTKIQLMLGDEADRSGLPIREFACTMLVSIASAHSTAFWQIGDGAICFRTREEESYHYAFWPEKGDYANVTYFVTDPGAQNELQFDVMSAPSIELALFSDGIERLALDFVAGEVHTGFFSGLFPHLRNLCGGFSEDLARNIDAFLRSERVNQRTDDDKTLILASRLS